MSGKHYNWHTRWRIDAATRTAVHDTGLRVPVAAGTAGIALNAADVQAALAVKHGHNAAAMVQRLQREAALFVEHEAAHGRA